MGTRALADVKPASVCRSYGPSQSGSVGVLRRPHLGEGYLYRCEGQEVADAPTQGDPLMSSFEFRGRRLVRIRSWGGSRQGQGGHGGVVGRG